MSFRFSTLCALVLVSAFLSQESAAAKNRHSLWSKVKSTFSSSTPSSTPRQSEAMAVRNAPVRHQMPAAAPTPPQRAPQGANTELFEIRRRANIISKVGLDYKFGGFSPSQGGMDCSGTMQHLIQGMGISSIPRTSHEQYTWVKNNGKLRRRAWGSSEKAYLNLKPGDLIFWGGTYNSGSKVSHVMLYLGKAKDGRHYMFGARSKKSRGMNGSGVDVFEMKPGSQGNLVGYGSIPGLRI
ncbi:C40 family peptidase [bacterium]|nr:C40 family peptidase [bacterium]